jgi:solute carrier family 25 protein 34/35
MSSTAIQQKSTPPWYEEFFIAGFAAVGSICFTNPIDVVKTRMTLQGPIGPIRNPLQGLVHVGKTEGLYGLQRGLPASCLWQFSNVSVRFGVYGVAKTATGVGNGADSGASPFIKWLKSLGLAGVSGGLAALASNPFFILKTRFQASLQPASASGGAAASATAASAVSASSASAPATAAAAAATTVGEQHALSGGLIGAARDIYRTDGPAGFFRGLSAFAPRVIVASAVQLSTYDAVKEWLVRKFRVPDGVPLVCAASFVTGAAVVLAMQPFDFAATRLVNSKSAAEAGAAASGAGGAAYTGPLDVIRQTLRTEGVLGLYRGAGANYLRFGPYCVLVFVFVEQQRGAMKRWRAA